MNIRTVTVAAGIAAGIFRGAQAADIADFDPRMAVAKAVVSNGVRWVEALDLPMEGRAFADVDRPYDRLPSNVSTNVNGGVRGMKCHTAGEQVRFRTNSRKLHFRWKVIDRNLAMDHMPASGKSGIDVYRFDAAKGRWRYVVTGRITDPEAGSLSLDWTPGEACLVNLPLYNGVKELKVGFDPEATIESVPHGTGVTKPVVFYGTSITHGGCASRPGLSFVNQVGRDLDVPVVNLGFSGSGKMELEMSEHLAAIDASCYVLDCIWNMNDKLVEERFEPFVRSLRAKRPDVPVVFAEQCDVFCREPSAKDRRIRGVYEKLVAEGWRKLVYLPKTEMYSGDGEGTVDGCHPNDLGMRTLATAFAGAVREALFTGGADATKCAYRPHGVTAEEAALMQKIAMEIAREGAPSGKD